MNYTIGGSLQLNEVDIKTKNKIVVLADLYKQDNRSHFCSDPEGEGEYWNHFVSYGRTDKLGLLLSAQTLGKLLNCKIIC